MIEKLRSDWPAENPAKRAAKNVSLVLIGSSLVLGGCRQPEDSRQDTRRDTARGSSSGYHGGRWLYAGSRTGAGWSGSGSSGGRPGAGVASRGGFGASGHAAASS